MDNPGLAFLKHMADRKVLELAFPQTPDFYKSCLEPVDYSQAQNIKILVFDSNDSQMSIERHYLVPKNISVRDLLIFSYILIREKIIKLCYKMMKLKWIDLNVTEAKTFGNREGYFISSRKNLRIFIEKKGLKKFENILKVARCSRVVNRKDSESYETQLRSTTEMTREEIREEFEYFFGIPTPEPESNEPEEKKPKIAAKGPKKSEWDDFNFEETPKNESKIEEKEVDLLNLEIEAPTKTPEVAKSKMEDMKLSLWSECLFQLALTDSLDENDFQSLMLNKAGKNDFLDFTQKFVLIKINSNILDAKLLKLKRCSNINMNIEIDKNITLNDCLSKIYYHKIFDRLSKL